MLFQKHKTNVFQIFLLILFIFVFSVNIAFAQDSFSLSVSPPTFEFNVNPGDIVENSIRVENLTDNPISVAVDYRNFIAVGEEGAVNLTEDGDNFSLNKWIESDSPNFVIPPKNRQIFKYKINIPNNVEPGGHFGSIVFKSVGNNIPSQTGAAVFQEIATLILVKVAGNTTEKANLITFHSFKNFWEYGPVSFESRIQNKGNIQVKPTGFVIIKNIFNQKIATIPLESKNILPGAIRRNTFVWNKKYLFGFYTATQYLNYGISNQQLIASTNFYGFPWKVGSLIISVIIIFAYFIYRGRRRIKKAINILFSKEDPRSNSQK